MQQFGTLERVTLKIPSGANVSIKRVGGTGGYDGHILRAYNYFPDAFQGIPETPHALNALKKSHEKWRQDSKAPTFALTYQGTWVTLMNNCGFSETMAKQIEANYHKMYEVSDKWKAAKIAQASIDGYSTIAFDLRIRTPLLKQVILGNNKTPYEAEAEGRTLGNAFGQSYGLMNSRSGMAVMKVIRASIYRLKIQLCAQIHDALYFRCVDDIKVIKFLNDIVGKEMSWQDLPEIAHDEVKLSGELDIFYPHWGAATTLPNYISEKEIRDICIEESLKRKAA